ncbi:MAG: DNA translocase FtsK 4TM domain-containing protein [Alphaproteobacteria bacterium]|nr:DNA translocase FtsK 4TM domain-containing protein [Alphaproteobacteria bacterium]
MTRYRTIRRKRKSGFARLTEQTQSFLARRLFDAFALALFMGGAYAMLALATYNHSDPSWNTAKGGTVANWAGPPGAVIADLLLQTVGIGGIALAAFFMIYGIRCFRRDALSPVWLRAVALMASVLFLSVAAAQIPSGGWLVHPYMGSSTGTLVLESLASAAAALTPFISHGMITFAAAILGLSSFAYAAAVTRDEAALAATAVKNAATFAAAMASAAAQNFIGWVLHYNDPDYNPKTKKRTRIRTQPVFDNGAADEDPVFEVDMEEPEAEEEEEGEEEEKTAAIPAIPVVAARSKKSARKPSQHKFPLHEGDWELPPLALLQPPKTDDQMPMLNEQGLRKNAELLRNVLADYNVEGDIVSISPGPVVTLYELEPAPGTKSSRVISLSDDIARSMSAVSVRSAVVPGRNVIGIELPNKHRQVVYMRELLSSRVYEDGGAKLPLILGKDIGGEPILADLAKMPHLLVAGTTGSGKSVAVNTMILSLLFRLPPEKCRFIMIDPKMLELSVYDDIPHLLSPVVTEPGKAVVALKWAVREMEDRYRSMSKLGVRNIEGYNERLREAKKKGETIMRKVQTGFDPGTGKPEFEDQAMDLTEIPYIVVVVDEFADLMLVAGKDVENAIQRLAQMARAAGIHLIMATQRPSVDVITGVIKANFPTRISFQVTSKIDSRTILGEGGAEQLLGMGDMLYMAPGGRITRVHGPFVSDGEVEKVVDFLKEQGEPAYIDEVTEGDDDYGDSEVLNAMFGGEGGEGADELYDQAVALVAREGKASTSFVQRYLQIGYNRAARIIEEMERQGVISKANAVGKREVLIRDFSDV